MSIVEVFNTVKLYCTYLKDAPKRLDHSYHMEPILVLSGIEQTGDIAI